MTRARSIAAALVCWLALAAPCCAAISQEWPLDDNAASTTVVETVGADATLDGGDNTSAKTVAGPGGSIAAGLDLNGTDDRIDVIASSISLAAGATWSVGGWAKFDATTGPLCGRLTGNQSRMNKGSDTIIAVQLGIASQNFTVPSLGTTVWRHVLQTHSAADAVRVFVDGAESSTTGITIAQGFSPQYLGFQNGAYFDGSLALWRVWNSDESANAAALYAEATGGGSTFKPRAIVVSLVDHPRQPRIVGHVWTNVFTLAR